MIEIFSNGNNVEIKATFQISGEEFWIRLSHNRGDVLDAKLFAEKVNNEFQERIKKIRKDSYERGWADKQSKRIKKKQNFNGNIKSDYVGY